MALLQTLTKWADFHVYFLCIGATDTSMSWFFGSDAVSVVRVRVAAVSFAAVWISCSSCHLSWSIHSDCHWGWNSCSACHFVIRSRVPLLPLRVLDSVEHGSVGMEEAPVCCSDLCLWYCQDDSILFPNNLLVFLNSALVQVWRSKTLEVPTGLCPCLYDPTHPATHNYPASRNISWYS